MTSNQQNCPKCQGDTEQGFVLDNTYGARVHASLAMVCGVAQEVVLNLDETFRRKTDTYRHVSM